MSSFFQKTNLLIIKLLNKGLLERMVPAFFGSAIPDLPSISSLRYEDAGSVGANGKIVLIAFIFGFEKK
jgi:hypothetical protein